MKSSSYRPGCTVCSSSKVDKVNAAFIAGRERGWIAATYGFSGTTIDRHKRHWKANGTKPVHPMPVDRLPTVPDDANATQRAELQVKRLEAELTWLHEHQAPAKQIADTERTLTGALRLLARVSGELEVSEAMLCRSAPWKKLLGTIMGVLRDYPDALRAMNAALERGE